MQNGLYTSIYGSFSNIKKTKYRNIHFVGNLILSITCKFCYNDVTVMSFINIKYGDVAIEVFS